MPRNPLKLHHKSTLKLAKSLDKKEIYYWLIDNGYYPESYVLPPCFQVQKRPERPKIFFKIKKNKFKPTRTQCISVHFPKSDLTDRNFGIIHPEIHNDIAFHIAQNWKLILGALFPKNCRVYSYSFPLPINSKNVGRLSYLRSGRMIYEYLNMIDDAIASIAYKYSHIAITDIKSFYPSIYTHSIPWAIHGKEFSRKAENIYNYKLVGNKLDKLFQNANDGCTNGIPIGPVVSDIIAELIAAGIDNNLSKLLEKNAIDCEVIRFKDDYRILTKSEADAKHAIKLLQSALKEFNLELNDSKTNIHILPEGLFREWASKYYLIHPKAKEKYNWKEFREIYLSVIRIDKECKNTGVIDRFLADLTTKKGDLKVTVGIFNLEKVISMLLMLGTLRIKAFPKIIAILEKILNSPFGEIHNKQIIEYLDEYILKLSYDEDRNKYLISWISYFIISNDLKDKIKAKPNFKDPITKTIYQNKSSIFTQSKSFKLFIGCKSASKKLTMFEYLDIFDPPK